MKEAENNIFENETEFIAGLRNKDNFVIDKMASAYSLRLLKSAFLLCGSKADAHDLVQETFLQSILNIHKFKEKSRLFTWLYGILLNLNRKLNRKKKYIFFPGFVPEKKHNPIIELENEMDLQKIYSSVYKIIETLSPKHKEVILLRYFESMKLKEIAFLLKVSNGTVKSRLYYATNLLKNKIPKTLNLFGSNGTNEWRK